MYLCYVDESGTPDIPGNTSHFVLAGLSIPVWHWKDCEREINALKANYDLKSAEIHTAWMLRKYLEQTKVADFDSLNYAQRRYEVDKQRKTDLLRLQKAGNSKRYRRTRKNYNNTEDYIHLNYDERRAFITEIAQCVSGWGFARLFAECVDKIYFDPARATRTVDEQAFEQIVSRFEQYLEYTGLGQTGRNFGLLIHDNNPTVAKKHRVNERISQKGYRCVKLKGVAFWSTNLRSVVE